VTAALTATVRSDALRRGALAAVLGALAFAVLGWLLAVGDGFSVVADRYPSLVMPARYTFAIWPVIALALAAYAIASRRRAQRAVSAHDALARLIVAASLIMPAWIVAFRFDVVSIAMLLKIALVVVADAMFLAAHDLRRRERAGAVWTVPFALLLGWAGVTTLVDLGVWLVAIGWRGAGIGDTAVAVAMIAVAAVTGVGVGVRFADAVVPLVVGWAMLGIWVAQREVDLVVGVAALVAGVACAAGAAIALVRAGLRADRPFRVVAAASGARR
jgi:hypothetical protein